MKEKPELLAPAGNWECARAAVANGADAIYFGLPEFNARMRADNFTHQDLPELMKFLHERGVKGYVAFNTLIFTGELEAAERQLIELAKAGVDAAIVQDVGLTALARKVIPDFHIHASTQMTLTSPEGVRFAATLGLERVVLARELSLRELAKFKGEDILPMEVFVHGALCVAYSGQCLTSEALGQRSANRGECAQACRLPYEMIVDGEKINLGDRAYLLSPQDLAAVEEIPKLIDLGICSFKIEGRLKTPEYVAAVSQVYRKAINAAWEKRAAALSKEDRYKLEMTFSRGLFSGWMHGVNHQELVHARFGKKRGPLVGLVKRVGKDFVEVDSKIEVKPGDGVVFDTGEDTNQEQGGRVYEIRNNRFYFQHGKIDFSRIAEGNWVWKTNDPQLDRELRKSFSADIPAKKSTLHVTAKGKEGEPLELSTEWHGSRVTVQSSQALQKAQKRPLTTEVLREQIGRLGETAFELESIDNQIQGEVMLPLSLLNQLRRDLVERLEKLAASTPKQSDPMKAVPVVNSWLKQIREKKLAETPRQDLEMVVLCRSLDQLDVALELGTRTLYVDFEDIRRYSEAVNRVRTHGSAEIFLATPRIQKAGEQGFFKLIENAKPDGVLVRNLGAMQYFQGTNLKRIGDFSLNVANPLTAELFMAQGLERLTVSYDLNAGQVIDLLEIAPSSWFELVLHQYMPMFHMEHCVFAAFLSEGTDHTNCGRPCDRHAVQLRDRVGMEHPVKADVGCRNTVFHGKAQSGSEFLMPFIEAGARVFRVELLNEDRDSTAAIIESYRLLLAGKLSAEELIQHLKVQSKLGVTRGTLENKR